MYKNDDDATKERISRQEAKYRYITINFLTDLFNGKITNISGTPDNCGVDVRFTAVTSTGIETYDVEVKERNKSQTLMERYPTAELKKAKYNSMCSAHTNNKLIYIQYINEVAYIYDMDKLNWEQVKLEDWNIKYTQYDDTSNIKTTPTYFIPYTQSLNKINVSKYYKDYANNQQRLQ